MQKLILTLIVTCTFACMTFAQTTQPASRPSSQPSKKMNTMNAPYASIKEYPSDYTPASVLQRAIDGLGYRYHWASEGLTAKDLAYDPGNAGKTAEEVLVHIHSLTRTILNSIKGEVNVRPEAKEEMDYETLRLSTLNNIKEASDYLSANPNLNFEERNIIFSRGDKESKYPLWRLLNGPLLDAVYHTGQIVSYRRSTGNPSNPKVNVFSGSDPNASK